MLTYLPESTVCHVIFILYTEARVTLSKWKPSHTPKAFYFSIMASYYPKDEDLNLWHCLWGPAWLYFRFISKLLFPVLQTSQTFSSPTYTCVFLPQPIQTCCFPSRRNFFYLPSVSPSCRWSVVAILRSTILNRFPIPIRVRSLLFVSQRILFVSFLTLELGCKLMFLNAII